MRTKSVAESDVDPRIIVALDTPSLDVARQLLKDLEGLVSFYKVGFELFAAHGWKAVELVRAAGGRVFLDLKLHDIPNTVSKTMAVLCEHDVDMVTVHTLGGYEMMKATRGIVDQRIQAGKKGPIILGVTILTSHREAELEEDLGITRGLEEEVCYLAAVAKRAGLDGVVSSPHETAMLRQKFPQNFLIVTPGIRPQGSSVGDQKRVFAPAEAIQAGASYLVIGRPITSADSPKKEVLRILSSLA
ncbi:MAG: orotidine-5'-phosphate decarboxylase [Candidatus Omnitrophota bacterium]|nr:orotidine-5'-phosphate decarboxylase [Candidatus Omnitrophota bacterium]